MGTNVSGDHAAFIFRVEVSRGRMLMGYIQVGRGSSKEAQEDLPTIPA